MVKTLFTAAILFFSLISVAQNDPKAKTILDEVSAKTKAYKSITADFDFSMNNSAAGINETSKGKIITQGNMYKLSVQGVEIYNDGKAQWTYMPEMEEVNISDANNSESDMELNPATIFTIYENGFKYTYKGEGKVNNKKTHDIILIPTESDKEFKKITISIDQANMQIVSATMDSKDGNTYGIKINSMETEKKYPESMFKFDKLKHTGVNVVDMR